MDITNIYLKSGLKSQENLKNSQKSLTKRSYSHFSIIVVLNNRDGLFWDIFNVHFSQKNTKLHKIKNTNAKIV